MADDPRGGPPEDDQAGRPGLDLPVQPAAEGRLPEEVRLQQLQQEPAPEGAAASELPPPLCMCKRRKVCEREISLL